MPALTKRENVRRMLRASHGRPVARHSPGSAIIVSRPQSLNQGYPARIVFASAAPSSGRAATNWSAARASCWTAGEGGGEIALFAEKNRSRNAPVSLSRFANADSPIREGLAALLATIVSEP